MTVKRYAIFCKTCQADVGVVDILDDQKVRYVREDGIWTARKRSDGYWGFECMHCGSISTVTPEEVEEVIERSSIAMKPARRLMLRSVVAKRKKLIKLFDGGIEVDGFVMNEVAA